MKNPFLVGERVYLRPSEMTDAPAIVPWMNDREVTRYLWGVRPTTEASQRALMERLSAGDDVALAIMTRAGDRFIGTTGLMRVNWRERSAGFGISIGDKSYWNRGIGTEVTRLVVGHAFHDMNLHRVWLEVFSFNTRGIRAYEKAGFKHEGVQREAHWGEGRYHDIHDMAVLREEWLAAEAAAASPAPRRRRAAEAPPEPPRATRRGRTR